MPGTKAGGLKTRAALYAKDKDFYKKIGKMGGAVSSPTKGFGFSKERARRAGLKSRRGPQYKYALLWKSGALLKGFNTLDELNEFKVKEPYNRYNLTIKQRF